MIPILVSNGCAGSSDQDVAPIAGHCHRRPDSKLIVKLMCNNFSKLYRNRNLFIGSATVFVFAFGSAVNVQQDCSQPHNSRCSPLTGFAVVKSNVDLARNP